MSITVKAPLSVRRGSEMVAVLDSLGRPFVCLANYDASGNPQTSNASAERYDPATDTWTTLASLSQYAGQTAYTIDSSDRVIIWGGQVQLAGGTIYNGTIRGEIYDPSGNTWSRITDAPLSSFYQGRYFQFGWGDAAGRLWVAGGAAGQGHAPQDFSGTFPGGTSFYNFNTAMVYSGGASGTWTVKSANTTDYPNQVGFTDSSSVPNRLVDSSGRFYIFPTLASPGSSVISYERYDPATDAWLHLSKVNSPIATNANSFSSCVIGDVFYVVAETGFFRSYTVATDTWTSLANPLGANVSRMVVFTFAGGIYLVGGDNGSQTAYSSTIQSYDIAANTWSVLADTLSVARRPRVLVAGSGVYFIGGNQVGNGGRSQVVEFWQPVSTAHPGGAWAAVIG